jgi:hypothetical protein
LQLKRRFSVKHFYIIFKWIHAVRDRFSLNLTPGKVFCNPFGRAKERKLQKNLCGGWNGQKNTRSLSPGNFPGKESGEKVCWKSLSGTAEVFSAPYPGKLTAESPALGKVNFACQLFPQFLLPLVEFFLTGFYSFDHPAQSQQKTARDGKDFCQSIKMFHFSLLD